MLLCCIVLLIAGSSCLACRTGFLKNHPFRIGILFGILSAIANAYSWHGNYDMGACAGLVNAPFMIAGLLFGPVAGITAGVISAIGRAIPPLCCADWWLLVTGMAASLIVSLYAVVFHIMVFDHQRPTIIPGAVTIAIGIILNAAIFYLVYPNESTVFEAIYTSLDLMIFWAVLAMVLSQLACWHRAAKTGDTYLTAPTRSFIVFGLFFVLLAYLARTSAETQTDELLQFAVARLDAKMTNTIELFMNRCAHHIMNTIADPLNCSKETLKQGIRDHGLDEANIISKEAKIIASSNDALINRPFPRTEKPTGDFFCLIDGNENLVTQGFRPARTISNGLNRYLGIPFPGRNAFLEVAYSIERLEKELPHFFLAAIADTPVYHNGFFLVVDKNGSVVNNVKGHPHAKHQKITQIGLSPDDLKKPEKCMFLSRVMGRISRCMIDRQIGELKVVAVLPLSDVHKPALRFLFLCSLALFCISLLFRWTLVKMVRNQKMIDELRKKNLAQEEHELSLARSIQTSELKEDNPDTDVYRIFAMTKPAREVGGDSYDYFPLPDGRVAIGIADVADKGISAAIFMMKARTAFRLIGTMTGKDITELLNGTNQSLCTHNDALMFATAWCGTYDPATQELRYICAGHNPPFIIKANGEVQKLNCDPTLPLGIRPLYHYAAQTTHLDHGDRIFLYTDGVTEAMNSEHQLFGEERLIALLKECGKVEDPPLIQQIQQHLDKYVGKSEQNDDITMLSMLIK